MNSHTENGKIVLLTEQRLINSTSDKTGEVVLKGSAEKLVERLIYDDSYSIVDPTYIQDFLFTYRVFIENPTYVSNKLFEWFQLNKLPSYLQSPNLCSVRQLTVKKKVYRIVLEWITNHFNDFETNKDLYEFVERFQEVLNKEKMHEQLRVLTIAISTKSKVRTITLARSKREETLMFSIQGGWDKGYGIFVSRVDKDSKAYELGIRKGDQILDVNGHSFQHILHANALDKIKSFTHLSIKLKYNPIGFNEMLLHPEKSPHRNKKHIINSNKAYLVEYLKMQQNQYQHAVSDTQLKPQQGGDATHQLTSTPPAVCSLQSNTNSTSSMSQLKKSIGSIPPLPPTSIQTPRNKSKEQKINGSSHNLNLRESNANHIRKMFNRFNRKAHSKDLETLQHTDASAPALKSITRSPSPSLSSFNTANPLFNRSNTTTSINSMSNGNTMTSSASTEYTTLTASHLNRSNVSHGDEAAPDTQMSASLNSINLNEQPQFAGEHVLKIYKNEQTFKYLVVYKETSTKEVVMLALNEFNIVDDIGSK